MLTSVSLEDAPVIAERYRVVRELGEGGMGVVYEVIDETTNRRRALKRIRAHAILDPELIRRFELEVTIAGRVESEHVVEVFDAGIDPSTQAPYIVMELLTGEDLGALIGREGGLGVRRALDIFEQLARGLARTHAEGIVHRDIKPENVFLSRREDGTTAVKLLDFGVAKSLALDTLSPATTRIVGTPLYMAPEQFSGDGTIDARADVYALGQLAFTVLVGSPYFEDERRKRFALPSLAMAIAAPNREAASARARVRGVTLASGFDEWFRCATAPEPEARFPTVEAACERLRDALETPAAVGGEHVPAVAPPSDRSRRGPFARAGIMAGAVALAIGGYVVWSVPSDEPSDAPETAAERESSRDEGAVADAPGESMDPVSVTLPATSTTAAVQRDLTPVEPPPAATKPSLVGPKGAKTPSLAAAPSAGVPSAVVPSSGVLSPSVPSAVAQPSASPPPTVPYDPLQDL